jgi:hypothetical protein
MEASPRLSEPTPRTLPGGGPVPGAARPQRRISKTPWTVSGTSQRSSANWVWLQNNFLL